MLLIRAVKGRFAIELSSFLLLLFFLFASHLYAGDVQVQAIVPLTDAYKAQISQYSIISVSPTSVAINEHAIITVLIQDSRGPLSHHKIFIGAITSTGNYTLQQLSQYTNGQGDLYADFSSQDAGNVTFYAIDESYEQTDNQNITISQNAYLEVKIPGETQPVINPVIQKIIPTPILSPTFIITPTVTPTPSPIVVSQSSPLTWEQWIKDLFGFVFGYNACTSENAEYSLLFILIMLLVYPVIWKYCHGYRVLSVEYSLVYTLVLLIIIGFEYVECFPLWIVILLWLLFTGIFMYFIHKKINQHEEIS